MYLCFVSYPTIVYSGLFFIEFLVTHHTSVIKFYVSMVFV